MINDGQHRKVLRDISNDFVKVQLLNVEMQYK
jgi:hypothetical protein